MMGYYCGFNTLLKSKNHNVICHCIIDWQGLVAKNISGRLEPVLEDCCQGS